MCFLCSRLVALLQNLAGFVVSCLKMTRRCAPGGATDAASLTDDEYPYKISNDGYVSIS
jgi:hypothetical protein